MSTTVLPKRYSPSVFNGVAGMIDNDQGGYVRFHDCVTYGTACAEAAKATGTAGEQSTLIGMEVSMDVSTGDEDFDHRIFGRIEGLMDKGDGTDIILAVEESRNFATDTQAARQPAPVAAQENGGLVRAALIDLMEIEQAATAGEFKQDMTFDFAKQSHYRALFARARAALAATAAPVLSDEQIDHIARSYFADEHGQTKAKGVIHDALRAATNRSQP